MQTEAQTVLVSKKLLWTGYIVSALPVLMLLVSGVMKIVKPPQLVDSFKTLEWDESFALVLAILEIGCTVIYLIPRSAVLGAILLTGYLGGATATHMRIHDQFVPPIILGVLVWGGLWFRDARLRALLPLRQ